MPAAPRPSKKATKIFFNILGVPANMNSKKSKKQKEIERSLMAQQTTMVR